MFNETRELETLGDKGLEVGDEGVYNALHVDLVEHAVVELEDLVGALAALVELARNGKVGKCVPHALGVADGVLRADGDEEGEGHGGEVAEDVVADPEDLVAGGHADAAYGWGCGEWVYPGRRGSRGRRSRCWRCCGRDQPHRAWSQEDEGRRGGGRRRGVSCASRWEGASRLGMSRPRETYRGRE